MLTPTALVTLDAVLEATGAGVAGFELKDRGASPIVAVRLVCEGATPWTVNRALNAVRRRGLLRAMVREPQALWVRAPADEGGPLSYCVLHFRCAAGWRPAEPRS